MTISQIKISFYSLVTAFWAGVFGYLLNLSASGGNKFWLMVISGLVFLAFYVLQILLIKNWVIFVVGLVQVSVLGLFARVNIWGLLFFVIFILWAVWRGKNVVTQGLQINLGALNMMATPLAITALAILIAFVYTPTLISSDVTIGQSVVANVFGPALPFLKGYVPGISLDMSAREMLRAVSSEAVVVQSEDSFLQSLGNTLSIRVRADDSLLNILVRTLNAQLAKIPKDYRQYIDIALGLLVFLTIKGFGFIFTYVIYLLVLLFYVLLRVMNFMSIVIEKVDKEIIQV